MKIDKEKVGSDSYWKYLEENSRVVSEWPQWLKGERTAPADASASNDGDHTEKQKLTS